MIDKNNSIPSEDEEIIDDSIEIEELPETEEQTEHHAPKKLIIAVATVLALLLALGIATYAISTLKVFVEENYFKTGSVDVNLNDGKPVIEAHEFIFEPGMTVTKSFFVQSISTWEVYYKLYMTDVKGELADVLIITVADGDNVLYQGTASDFTRSNTTLSTGTLQVDEKRDLTISFYYPRESGNETQSDDLSFTLWAEVVQTKNNPDALFD